MPAGTCPGRTCGPQEEEAAEISSRPLGADTFAGGRRTQPRELCSEADLSLPFRKGAFGELRGCCAFPTPLASPPFQLTFASPVHGWDNGSGGHLCGPRAGVMVNS